MNEEEKISKEKGGDLPIPGLPFALTQGVSKGKKLKSDRTARGEWGCGSISEFVARKKKKMRGKKKKKSKKEQGKTGKRVDFWPMK